METRAMIPPRRRIARRYWTAEGRCPYDDWFKSLRDVKGKGSILARVGRAESGNFGDFKALGDGVYELRVHLGPGYRVYLGLEGDRVILLLCGGAKGSQERDIVKAKDYWADYLAGTRGKRGPR